MDYEEPGIELPPWEIDEEEEEDEESEEEDEESEEEEEESEEEEEEEEEEDYADGGEVDEHAGTTLRQVLYGNGSDITFITNRGEIDGENEGELNRGEVDGLFCPICFEAWSSGGDHSVCCLPCGHIYGLSCIKKWLHRRGSSKCPQCKKKCDIKDIRHLYATRIVTIDGELQKKVQSLEAKCVTLENKSFEWSKKEVEWKKREADLHKQVKRLKERAEAPNPEGHVHEEHVDGQDEEMIRKHLTALEQRMASHEEMTRNHLTALEQRMASHEQMIRNQWNTWDTRFSSFEQCVNRQLAEIRSELRGGLGNLRTSLSERQVNLFRSNNLDAPPDADAPDS